MTKSGRHSKNHGSLAGDISRGFAARDGSAVKSHSTILQRLRRQISLDYYTIPPATQANKTSTSPKGLVKKYRGGEGVGRSRERVGHEVLTLVQGVGRAIFSYP